MPDRPFSFLDPKKINDENWPFKPKRPYWDRDEDEEEENKPDDEEKSK